MNIPCVVSAAENAYAARAEARDSAFERAKEALAAEFMAAARMPLIATVSTPRHRPARSPFIETLFDHLSADKNRNLSARLVSILMRSVEGREVVQVIANQHADFYAEDAVGDDEDFYAEDAVGDDE